MANAIPTFQQRLRRIAKRHRRLSRGYVPRMDKTGLISVRPRREFHFPVRGAVLLVLAFLGFKGFLLAHLGPDTFADRVGALAEGTFIEAGGAWLMQADPATQWIAGRLGPMMR